MFAQVTLHPTRPSKESDGRALPAVPHLILASKRALAAWWVGPWPTTLPEKLLEYAQCPR